MGNQCLLEQEHMGEGAATNGSLISPNIATMDTIGRKKNKNPRYTLFEKTIPHANEREKSRTSLSLAAGHRGHQRRGGERLEGLPEGRVKEERGWGLSP
jgi:flagellar basal body rod protein FlgB